MKWIDFRVAPPTDQHSWLAEVIAENSKGEHIVLAATFSELKPGCDWLDQVKSQLSAADFTITHRPEPPEE